MMRNLQLSKKIGIFLIVLAALLVGAGNKGFGQVTGDYRSNVATGTWNTVATWQRYNGSAWVAATVVPTATNNVAILSGHNITVSVATALCLNLAIQGTLTVSNSITVSGTTTVNGTVIHTSTTGTKNMGTVVIAGGTWTSNAAETYAITGLTLSGSTINGTSTGIFNVGAGGLTITSSTSNTCGAATITITGTSTINGLLTCSSATGTKTFTGALSIVSGGSFSTGNSAIVFGNNYSNEGTFTAGSSAITITGTLAQSIGGFTTTGTVSCTKTAGTATLTGNVNGGALSKSGAGTLDLGSGFTHSFTGNWARTAGAINGNSSILNIGGTVTNTAGTFTAGSSTVNYTGGAQTIANITYNNLILSGTLAKTIPAGTSVSGDLSIRPAGTATASITALQNITIGSLTLGGFGKINGTWGGTGSGATNINTTYFAATTGYLTVTNDTRLTPVFSGLTASQSICKDTPTISLSGTVSAGSVYPGNGETVGVTINGNTQNATISGGAGGFSINFATSAIPSLVTPYTISYSYSGTNTGNLKAAANDVNTTFTVNPLTVISSQSTGAQTQCLSGTFGNISVTASGSGTLTYQWYSNTTASTSGGTSLGSANGAQTASYTPQTSSAGTLYYYCIVNGTCGSVTSSISGAFVVYAVIGANTLDFTNGTHGIICGTANENANTVLTAPAGTVYINVGFASYGTPNGTCPNFTIGTCHASSSQSIAESNLLGNNTATIPATNAVFGDPCVGTGKRLYISATYTEPVCAGTTLGTITGTAPAGGTGTYVYLWESSTTGSSSGFASASGTNNSKDYNPSTLSQTTWYRRTVTSGGCTDISPAVQITVNGLPNAPIVGTITQPTCGTATATVVLSGLPTSAWTVTASPGGSTITGSTATANFSGLAANNNYTFTVTLTSSGCTSVASATAAVNAQPTTPSAPSTTGGLICIGSTATLSASGGGVGDQYLWYDAATSGNLLQSNVSTNYTTPVLGSTTNYWVSILNTGGCEGTRTQVTATYPSASSDNQNAYGTDSWVGHVYDGSNFNTYYGSYTEPETFNQSFGGSTTCFNFTSNSVARSIYTETFSVRYRMNSGKQGLYVVDLGSDDGSRLTVDGVLVYNNWVAQGFTTRPRVLMNLSGASSLVYDFFENGGQNQVVFQNLTLVLANSLINNTSQDICLGSSGSSISGDAFGTLPTGITLFGTGYQWAYSTASASGSWTDISGATSAAYTPSAASAPFNVAGTYYLMRKAILLSASNNIGVLNYEATNSSNSATLIVTPSIPASVSIGATATTICAGTSVTFTASPTNGGTAPTYQWKLNGSNVGTGETTYVTSTLANNDLVSCEMTSNATPCLTGSPATSNTVTMIVSSVPTIANAGPDQTGASTCGLNTVTLAANTPTDGTGAWTMQSGVGGSFGNASSPVSSFSGNPGSTYTLRWTISNLPCVDSYDETTITFNTIPTITGTNPAERCGAGSVTLGATPSAGIVNWYNDLTGGSSLATGATFATPIISSSTTYYVDATSNGCITGSRTAVTATVNALPTITASPDATICSGSNTTLTAGGGSSYVWSPSTGLSSTSGTSVTASPTATTTYTVTGTDSNGCSNTASITVTVNELPTFSSVAANCAPDLLSYSVTVTVSSGTLTSTEGIVNNTSGNDWTVSLIAIGTNTTLTITDANTCLNTSIVMAPDCSCPTISAPVSGGNQQYCNGGSVPEISASVASGETVDWYSVSSGGTSLSTGLTYTPSSAGTYYAEARNTTSNCKSSTRTAVTITENPNASISLTSASGTDGQTVCINSLIANITYLVGGGGTDAGVTGLPGGLSGSYNAGVFTISGSPTTSGTYNYTVTTTGTCSQTFITGTVTVDQASVGGTISGAASSICLGASTGTLTLSGYTGTIVQWYRQINSGGWNSVGSGGSSTFSETPYSSGIWEYRATVQTGDCTPEYSSIFSLDVDPITVAGWITGSSSDHVCEGASTPTLTLNGSTGNVLRWEKQLNSGVWQNISNTSTTFSEVPTSGGTWGYRALVQSGTCSQDYQTPFTVVVNPTLTITLGSDPVICQTATSATLSYTATSGSPAGWVLDFDGSAISAGFGSSQNGAITGSSGNITINIPYSAAVGVYHATLKVITYYPVCSSVYYPVSISVNPNLPVSVSIAADANPVCAGTNVTFTAAPINGGSTPSYQWKKNGGDVGSNSSIYTDATLANGDQITCVLTSNATCATGNPATSNTVTMTVNPNLPVSVSIGASANPICAGTSVTFTASPTNGGSTPSYQWIKNGGNVGSNSATYTDAALVNGDQITCVLTSDVICASGNPATSNTLIITVNSLSVAPTGITGTTTICAGGSTTLTLSGGTAGTGATAEWFTGSCGGTSAGTGNSITVSPASNTTYYVRYTGTCNTTTCAMGTVVVTPTPSISLIKTNETCPSSNDGAIITTLSGGISNIRYIKLTQKYASYQQVAEIQAFEVFTNSNVALSSSGAIATSSSSYQNNVSGFGPQKVNDNITTGYNFWHSFTANADEWVKVDFVSDKNIDYLRIFNREDCCWDRGQNMLLELFDASNNLVYSKTVDLWQGVNGAHNIAENVLDLSWSDSGNTLNRTALDAGTYTLNYSDASGCLTNASGVISTTNNESTAPVSVTGINSICAGESTILSVSGGSLGTTASWHWYSGSCGGVPVGVGSEVTVSPMSDTTYFVRAEGTCNNTTCASATLTVNPVPTPGEIIPD